MSEALTKALTRTQSMADMARQQVMNLKDAGTLAGALTPLVGGFGAMQDVSKTQRRYNQFRGWLYSVVNMLASEAAGQPVFIGRMGKESEEKGKPKSSKEFILNSMTKNIRNKVPLDNEL